MAVTGRQKLQWAFSAQQLMRASADVVLVMASRPGRFIERIAIDLPRPRIIAMLGSERLGALRNRIWDLIADPQMTVE
jgi:ABC-type nitrate/sulfonate/bicarbonate transport system ATPase subunit